MITNTERVARQFLSKYGITASTVLEENNHLWVQAAAGNGTILTFTLPSQDVTPAALARQLLRAAEQFNPRGELPSLMKYKPTSCTVPQFTRMLQADKQELTRKAARACDDMRQARGERRIGR